MLELAQRPPYGAEFVASMINATDAHRGTGAEFLDELVKWAYELP